jgi:hypothetical protein
MSTSLASGSSRPSLSIVVASNGAEGSVEQCLASLEAQVDGEEVIVCPRSEREIAPDRFSFARYLEPKEKLVPELWRDGIDAATGEAVALTISPMQAAPDWVARLRGLLAEGDAVGGAIDPGSSLRLRDWAEYFCRYARDMRPFPAHECLDLPGDNAAYRRVALTQTREVWQDGFWEPDVHRGMSELGHRLWHSPELVVHQGRSAGMLAFCSQRFVHGRAHGTQRGARFSTFRNVAGVVGAPLVPPLLTWRVLRQVRGKRRYRLQAVLSMPLMLLFDLSWAAGEAVGHVRALRNRT